MRILITRLSAMGDAAMTVPVVYSIAKQYPEAEIVMVSMPRVEPLFANIPRLKFIGANTKKEYKGVLGIYRLFKRIREEGHFDLMLDLHDVIRTKVLRKMMWLTGTKIATIDKGRKEKNQLISGKRKEQLKAMIERYAETAAKGGLNIKVEYPGFMRKDAGLVSDDVRQLLDEKTGRWIGIAPFAQHKGKIYPEDKMREVIRLLAAECEKVILFGGGGREKEILDQWAEGYSNVVNITGRFGLKSEMEILNALDTLISMDSANMHLASLVGTRVVSVWGATHPFMGFYGYGQKTDDAIQTDMECRPCSAYGNKECKFKDYGCLSAIRPEDVARKALTTK